MTVHTGTFYLLEGLLLEEREVVILAVSYTAEEMFAFVQDFTGRNETYDAFRVTSVGGVIEQPVATPTHQTPAGRN